MVEAAEDCPALRPDPEGRGHRHLQVDLSRGTRVNGLDRLYQQAWEIGMRYILVVIDNFSRYMAKRWARQFFSGLRGVI